MKSLAFVAILMAGAPALAQAPQQAAPIDPSCPPEHAAMGHCTPRAAPPPAEPASGGCPPDEEAMGFCTAGAAPKDDPHAGHQMPAVAGPPVAPPPPGALSGPDHAADALYPPGSMARARAAVYAEHGGHKGGTFLIDRLETGFSSRGETLNWDAQGWYGTDEHRLWLKTEGEAGWADGLEGGEVQLLYGRPINPWWTLQLGARQDFGPGPSPTHAVLGLQGLAPYWFELDAALFLSTDGDLTAGVEAEYDQRVTNRLILQPRAEMEFAFQDVPGLGLGSGLTSVEIGARLRYEFVPEFAPYVGVELERKLGRTARFARDDDRSTGGWAVLLGLRAWF